VAKNLNRGAGKLQKQFRSNFAGGWNSYLGVRQIKDSESPDMSNCDFKGAEGIGNRQGYAQISTVGSYASGVKGIGELHTASYHQALAFVSNASNVIVKHSTDGGAWTQVTGTTFTNINMDGCQASGNFYVGNGTDAMKHWDGSAWNTTTNGTIGYYPTYYNQRLWVQDETNLDRLNFSGQYSEQLLTGGSLVNKLADFSDATSGWISFRFGSGTEITGLRVFKDALYVFLRDAIYKIVPATAANTFTITLITNAVGCVSHRSIDQLEEDLYFAADDGVYALGEVVDYISIRTTNKSAKIQGVFTNLTATNKAKLVGRYFNFKYHLFYSQFGTNNDSVVAYDIRYGGWLDWRNMAANAAQVYIDSTNAQYLYFGHPTSSAVYKLYSGTTDDGTTISSYFNTKSFDEDMPDVLKVYFDHTFVFGLVEGTITVTVIFDDNQTAGSSSISQTRPQGGLGRDALGVKVLGGATNTITTINSARGVPRRMSVSDKKFAVQYKISSSGDWRLDTITTTFKPLSHYAFPSTHKMTVT